jgi:PST family polysaccharide transporter
LPEETQAVQSKTSESETYGQILKSSVLVGGSQMILIFFRLIRGKAMAYLLAPAGFGLFSIYGSIEGLVEDVAGMGVSSSGVRQIAEAAGTGDKERIAQTAAVLQRTSVVLGALGTIAMIVFSRQISIMTFGSPEHTWAICLLSVAVILQIVSYGQDALLEGLRRIADFSKAKVLGFLFSTILSIPIVYFFREDGVVPSLVVFGVMTVLCSWWYRRKIKIHVPSLTASQVTQEASALLKLGSVLMLSNLLQSGLAYMVRTLILRKDGLEAAGLYQAAWTLGGMYVGFIIKAMAADFYPRLTASASINDTCNRLVNEQARMGLLLAGPGVIATLTFSPAIVTLLYTAKFVAGVEVLRWICLGTMLQVITWPMGYIVVAKNLGAIFFWCETACAAVYAALAWVCIGSFGLKGAGIAFLGYCIFHGVLYYPIMRRVSGFLWSRENIRSGLAFLGVMAGVCCGFYLLPPLVAVILGTLATLGSSIYSFRVLSTLVSWEQLPRPLRRLIAGVGLAPSKNETSD